MHNRTMRTGACALFVSLVALVLAFVLASASFAWAATYDDVPADSWYAEYVSYVSDTGLMNGYAGTQLFGPNDQVTRAQVATVLWRFATAGQGTGTHGIFCDVPEGEWYTDAVEWCYAQGIVNGYTGADELAFGPYDPVTREQLCSMLFRFATMNGYGYGSATLAAFPDVLDVTDWAVEGMAWCVNAHIVSGNSTWNPPHLDPAGTATRAQLAKMLTVLCRDVLGNPLYGDPGVNVPPSPAPGPSGDNETEPLPIVG